MITWNFPPRRGGIEDLIRNLCENLKKRHQVSVITAYEPSPVSEDRVFRAPWPGLVPFALYALWRGGRLLQQNPEIEVIYGGSVMVTPLVLVLARLFGRKVIVHAHGLDLVYRSYPYQLLCVRWIRYCGRVIANSHYTASLAIHKGAPPELVSVIPPGVHPERFAGPVNLEAIKKELGLEGRRVILFVGRLAKRKGVKEFIQESLPKIVERVPAACLAIAGGNPNDSLTQREDVLREIKAAVSETGLANHVRLFGRIVEGELISLYQACDVVVLPALEVPGDVEGFGIVLLEAAAAGKPVVATAVGGIPDAVEDGKSGILAGPGDYAGLSRSIIALLTDKEKSLAMGVYGQRRVQQKFAWNRIGSAYETALGINAGAGEAVVKSSLR
ncbi:MAG TPA: glycosyltransferase family 4 protein [Candidatus Binatia bacterium]|nr:glycosyltransferase family 4 protein [Candidatus Binatia bacterium]